MRSKTCVLVLAVLSVFALAFDHSPVSAQSKKDRALIGTWDVQGRTADGQEFPPAIVVFEIKKGKLTGYYEDDEERAELRKIRWEKDKLLFEVTIEAGEYTDVSVVATLDGENKMSGDTSSDILGENTFTATRRKKD